MAILTTPVPDPPGPGAAHNANREADTLSALQETKETLKAMIQALDAFTLTQFTDADGNIWQGLLIANGQEPVLTAGTSLFDITVQENPDDAGNFQVGVGYGQLNLLPTPQGSGNVASITGMPADFGDDLVYLDLDNSDTDYAWIEGSVDITAGTAVFGLKINTQGNGGDIDPTAAMFSADNAWAAGTASMTPGLYVQNKFRYLLAEFKPSESGPPDIKRYCYTNLTMINDMINGQPVMHPVPASVGS